MTDTVLSDYLSEIARIRATGAGTGEISYYSALAGALNATGQKLKPRVFCVSNLRNTGAGFPDMGLFAGSVAHTPDSWPTGRPPERGVVEVDDIPAELSIKQNSAQVARYLANYGLVLVTNYRDFVLLGHDAAGRAEIRERFSFGCQDAAAFFALARAERRPTGLASRFAEFLQRVLLHQAPLAKPEDVAFFLASYARDALTRVEEQAKLPAFAELRAALQEALGLAFDGPKGEHLFRSTLVQTLFYGLFSAWVEVAREGGVFDWRAAGWSLHVPFVDTLFQRIAAPQFLRPLGLEDPLSWASAALNRVDRPAFFARFQDTEAVRYFYEPFLAAFDPELRRAMGVWYTPREIVRYMVERVDRVLRTELGIADGLADPSVWVLDPCCGTGAYLVEVLDRIARTLREKGEDALIAEDLKQAAMTRVAGFEIMPAPYVIAHWQIGHVLRAAGIALADNERAAIYLTNALTGWTATDAAEPEGAAQHGIRLTYPPLADERAEATRVKQARPILVVLGNPPYNAFAGTSPAEESGLVEPYKEGLRKDWGIKKFNLDDLYVRFFRVAERRIAEGTGQGVVCFISNHSWLSYASFVVMRQRLLAEFDRIWVDNLNGSKFETGKLTPDGRPDPSVFSTDSNREGIQVGTAVALLVRKPERGERVVRYRDLWGTAKRAELLAGLAIVDSSVLYTTTAPRPENRFALRPTDLSGPYAAWAKTTDLSAIPPLNGPMEKRRGALIDYERPPLEARMRAYFDAGRSWNDIRAEIGGLGYDAARFPASATRRTAVEKSRYRDGYIQRYLVRPFDLRWAYATPERPIWNEPRPELLRTLPTAGGFLATRPAGVANPEGFPLAWTRLLGDNDALRGHAYYTPVFQQTNGTPSPNLSPAARAWLAAIGLPDPDTDPTIATLPWHHALAIGYSPAWLAENSDGIRQDWPRVPLPDAADLLQSSAALGARVAALLDPETPVPSLADPIPRTIAVISKHGGGAIQLADRSVTAGWGHAGKGGAVMPGRGRVVSRPFTETERPGAEMLGPTTNDIYLNADTYWANVPDAVWDFTIGGYQVLKKWLSYREQPLLGRPLATDELRHVRDTARRLAALRLMAPELDANYRACAAAHRPLTESAG